MCNLCAKNKKSCTQICLTHINKGFVLCTQNHEINIRVDFFRSLKDLEEEKIYGKMQKKPEQDKKEFYSQRTKGKPKL